MGIIGYELIVLGFACIEVKAEQLIPIRKHLMLMLLTTGFCLSALALWDIEPSLSILFGILTVACFCLLIWTICTRNRMTNEILHIPAGSYEVEIIDSIGTPAIQLSYRLVYREKGYFISTMPPKGKPALILHTRTQKKSDIMIADIAIDTINEPLSIKQKMYQLYNILVLLVALFLPIAYVMYEKHYLTRNLMPNCIMIVLGHLTISATYNSRAILYRLIYWFAVFLEVAGWFIIPITYLLN